MDNEMLMIIIPYVVIYLILVAVSWAHILKHDSYKKGNRGIWLVVTLLVHFVGPILYFTIGKDD